MKKALEILKDIQDSKWCGVKPTLVKWKLEDFNEAIKELVELENNLKDLFKCIELTEDENSNERLNSMEIYLIRLSKYIK